MLIQDMQGENELFMRIGKICGREELNYLQPSLVLHVTFLYAHYGGLGNQPALTYARCKDVITLQVSKHFSPHPGTTLKLLWPLYYS